MDLKKGILIAALLVALAPSFASAAFTTPNVWSPTILKGPLVTCHGAPINIDAQGNPSANADACQSLCDLIATFINIVYFLIGFVLWILTPLFFAVSGVMFLVAGASPEMVGTARKTMTGTLVGIIIVLFGWLIVNTLLNAVGASGVGGFGGAGTCNIAAAATP